MSRPQPTAGELVGADQAWLDSHYPGWDADEALSLEQRAAALPFGADGDIAAAVAANPGCPTGLLAHLAASEDFRVREAVAANPRCAAGLLVGLAEDRAADVRAAVAAHPNTPPSSLAALAGDDAAQEALVSRVAPLPPLPGGLAAARRAQASAHLAWRAAGEDRGAGPALGLLAGDSDAAARAAAATHPCCPPETLGLLAADGDQRVREAAAEHPACPPAVLGGLLDDGSCSVRAAAAANPGAPPARLLLAAAADPDPGVCCAAARNPAIFAAAFIQAMYRTLHPDAQTLPPGGDNRGMRGMVATGSGPVPVSRLGLAGRYADEHMRAAALGWHRPQAG